jgi:hypothetical protein
MFISGFYFRFLFQVFFGTQPFAVRRLAIDWPGKKLCGSLVAGITDTHIACYEKTIWLFSRCYDFADKRVWRHINDFCRFADNTVCA